MQTLRTNSRLQFFSHMQFDTLIVLVREKERAGRFQRPAKIQKVPSRASSTTDFYLSCIYRYTTFAFLAHSACKFSMMLAHNKWLFQTPWYYSRVICMYIPSFVYINKRNVYETAEAYHCAVGNSLKVFAAREFCTSLTILLAAKPRAALRAAVFLRLCVLESSL